MKDQLEFTDLSFYMIDKLTAISVLFLFIDSQCKSLDKPLIVLALSELGPITLMPSDLESEEEWPQTFLVAFNETNNTVAYVNVPSGASGPCQGFFELCSIESTQVPYITFYRKNLSG